MRPPAGLAPGTRYEIFVISVNDLGETDSEPVTHETSKFASDCEKITVLNPSSS